MTLMTTVTTVVTAVVVITTMIITRMKANDQTHTHKNDAVTQAIH